MHAGVDIEHFVHVPVQLKVTIESGIADHKPNSHLLQNKVENPHNGPSAILVKRVTGNNGINW